MPLILLGALFLVFWIRHFTRRAKKIATNETREFWKRENEANCTSKKSIDSIPLVPYTLDLLPPLDQSVPELAKYHSILTHLSGKPIANLNQYSNTELKLNYGAMNFSKLYQYDKNYIELIRCLNQIADYYIEMRSYELAIPFLKYSIELDQTNKSYILLARCYLALNDTKNLEKLKETIHNLSETKQLTLMKQIKKEEQDAIANQ